MVANERNDQLDCAIVRHVFRGDEFLAVFSDRSEIGTEKVREGHGLGWSAGRVRVRSLQGESG